MQHDRNVAAYLDITRGELRDQPVAGHAGDAHDDAEDRGEHDPECRHVQRVEDADEQRPAVGPAGIVGDQGLADAEPGLLVEEAEAGGDALPLQVQMCIVVEVPAEQDDTGREQHLVDHPPEGEAVEDGRVALARKLSCRHSSVDRRSACFRTPAACMGKVTQSGTPPDRGSGGAASSVSSSGSRTSGHRPSTARSGRAAA